MICGEKMLEISDAQAELNLLHLLNEDNGGNFFIRTQIDRSTHLSEK